MSKMPDHNYTIDDLEIAMRDRIHFAGKLREARQRAEVHRVALKSAEVEVAAAEADLARIDASVMKTVRGL